MQVLLLLLPSSSLRSEFDDVLFEGRSFSDEMRWMDGWKKGRERAIILTRMRDLNENSSILSSSCLQCSRGSFGLWGWIVLKRWNSERNDNRCNLVL